MTVDVGPTRGENSTGRERKREKEKKEEKADRRFVLRDEVTSLSFLSFFRWRSICCQLLGPLPKGLRLSEFSNSILRDFFPPRTSLASLSRLWPFASPPPIRTSDDIPLELPANIFAPVYSPDRDFENNLLEGRRGTELGKFPSRKDGGGRGVGLRTRVVFSRLERSEARGKWSVIVLRFY